MGDVFMFRTTACKSLAWSRDVSRVEYLFKTVGYIVVVFNQYICREIALASDTRNSAIETQLTANLVAFTPCSCTALATQVIWCHTDIYAALVGSMLCPPVRKQRC